MSDRAIAMDAMILSAGVGSRLGAITARLPKALVEVGGRTMLERIARRLIDAGADRLVINVHHHAEQILAFLHEQDNFGVDVCVSHEHDEPLETGGGLLHARRCFRRTAPFYLHNVDIITDIDLRALYTSHVASGALVTMAVHERTSTRQLLFDADGLYARSRPDAIDQARAPRGDTLQRAFAGVHVVAPELLDLITEHGRFGILDTYLRLAGAGYRIRPYDVSGVQWLEIGTPDRLAEARRQLG